MERCYACNWDDHKCYVDGGYPSLRGLIVGALVGCFFAGWLGLLLGGGAGMVLNAAIEGRV